MLNVTVLVSGGGTNLAALIDSVEKGDIDNAVITTVISNKKDAYALTRAKEHGINGLCISPKDYSDRDEFADAMLEALSEAKTDLVVLAGYLVIVPEKIIKEYKGRIINIHPSLIPSHCGPGFYGLHVHESVLARGNKVTGATVHFVDEGTDTGPIIIQKAVYVKNDDTPESLQRRVMEEAEWLILPEAVKLIADGKVVIENNIAKIVD
ncbi:MAG: phosphoribosylglycinamide formyltransferase [Lachnospiraceae bacterium]|nr:phosphoribosylglycinamide formyltransferase [Lachnospiraceae bacterium]